MQSEEIGSQWKPMDTKLYKAASEGRIDILENLIRAERIRQQLQQPAAPSQVGNRRSLLQRVTSENYRNNPRFYTEVARPEQAQQEPAGIQEQANEVPPGTAEQAQQVLPERPFSRFFRVTYGGDTILHIAIQFGHLQVASRICHAFRSLLLKGNKQSETPLHYAARAGNHEVVDELIQAARVLTQSQTPDAEGVDGLKQLLRSRNQDGETALYQAVHNKHFAVVEVLINADRHLASIPDNNNVSPLYLAAMRNSLDIVKKLIEFLGDASPEAYVGPHGQTALHAAALRKEGFTQSIFDFKQELANIVDGNGSTPLHFAAADNNIESVKVLLKNDRTSAYIADSSGLFPVHVAAKLGKLEVLIQIFEHCPDSDELLDAQGRNFIHTAVENIRVNVVRWVCNNSRLVKAMNAKDNEGNTPMHIAVEAKNVHIFAQLIESKKVYKDIMNKKGLTPLDSARAQLKGGLKYWKNSEYVIFRTLAAIGSCGGINRLDLYKQQYKLEWDQEKMLKDAEGYENIAKSISIGTVLIASASFTGAFTVCQAYKADVIAYNNLPRPPGMSLAFTAFVIMVVYAFICSITATALLIRAALTYVDQKYRSRNIVRCIALVMMAIRAFICAFAIGAYIILIPVSKRLAIGVCLTGIVVPVFMDPHVLPNIILTRALPSSIGWKELRRVRDTVDPRVPQPIRAHIFWDWNLFLFTSVSYGLIVLLVLLGSLINNVIIQNAVLPIEITLLLINLRNFAPRCFDNLIERSLLYFHRQKQSRRRRKNDLDPPSTQRNLTV